jgi:PAS domain S-box-containing protein
MRRSSDQLRLFCEASPNEVLAVDPDGTIIFVNAQCERMLGYGRDELVGHPVELLIPFRLRDGHVGLRQAFAAVPQQRPMGVGRDLLAQRKDGSEFPVEIGLSPVETEDGPCVLAVMVDISDRKRAEERQRLLIGELNHRIQNLFAVIQSVAYNSLSGQRPIAEAREVFIERLHSLGRTYTIMTEQQWRGAPIRQILAAELSAFSDRVALDGIDVMVRQSSAQSFALLFHELTTNAVKYGALSATGGHVDVRWAVDREAQPATFRFTWEERGGPPVLPPTRSGYGRKIIEETVRRLGRHQISYVVDGVKYRMEARLDKIGWVIEEGGRS